MWTQAHNWLKCLFIMFQYFIINKEEKTQEVSCVEELWRKEATKFIQDQHVKRRTGRSRNEHTKKWNCKTTSVVGSRLIKKIVAAKVQIVLDPMDQWLDEAVQQGMKFNVHCQISNDRC